MLSDIRIENFRCFHRTEIKGFRAINLISGKNNSGKTALLEAIYILKADEIEKFINLRNMRRESEKILTETPEIVWDEFFRNRNTKENIKIIDLNPIEFSLNYKRENGFLGNETHVGDSYHIYSNKKYFLTSGQRSKFQPASILYSIELSNGELMKWKDGKTIAPSLPPNQMYETKGIAFIMSRSFALSDKQLTKLFTEVRKKDENNVQVLLEAFQAIDNRVELVEILVDAEPTLYIRRKGEITRQLKMFGDAMNRIAEFILKIIANENGVLLIDEIENGIHWNNQEKVWEIIFTLAEKHKVQIFATTHSKEMIEHFAGVAKRMQKQDLAAYVEMYQSVRSGEIAAHIHEVDLLEYELRNNVEIRGLH